jgi:antitoxin component HigA of HigAB toxin-antitoxin module
MSMADKLPELENKGIPSRSQTKTKKSNASPLGSRALQSMAEQYGKPSKETKVLESLSRADAGVSGKKALTKLKAGKGSKSLGIPKVPVSSEVQH